jgi:hypothetical protein
LKEVFMNKNLPLNIENARIAAQATEKIRRKIMAVAPNVVRDAMTEEDSQLTLIAGSVVEHSSQPTSPETIAQAS